MAKQRRKKTTNSRPTTGQISSGNIYQKQKQAFSKLLATKEGSEAFWSALAEVELEEKLIPLPSNIKVNADGIHIYHTGGDRPQMKIDSNTSDIEQATQRAENIIRQGVEQKRKSNYSEAEKLYQSAIDVAPWYVHGYYALGKLYYLTNEQDKSLLYYTVAAHIHLGLGAAQKYDDELQVTRQAQLGNRSPELLQQFNVLHPHAKFLLIDNNTPRHLGHAFVDLRKNEQLSPEISASAKAYRQNISGGFFSQIDLDLEEAYYQPTGVSYLVENTQWSKVGRVPAEAVLDLYSEKATFMSAKAAEMDFSFALNVLSQTIGVSYPQSNSSIADLQCEVERVLVQLTQDERIELRLVFDKALQTTTEILTGSFYVSLGSMLLDSLNSSPSIFQPLMARRWRDTIGSKQTPFEEFWFHLSRLARNHATRTPNLGAIRFVLQQNQLNELRNALVHKNYSWIVGEHNSTLHFVDFKGIDWAIPADVCEAFHIVLGTCAIVIDRLASCIKV